MSSDYSLTPKGGTRRVALSPTDYFSSQLTNEIGLGKVVTLDNVTLFSGLDFVLNDGKLLLLSESAAANHIGISAIALTSDGCIVHQLHAKQVLAPDQLAPSSSGSLDLDDYLNLTSEGFLDPTLEDLIKHGMMREMNEEIGAKLCNQLDHFFDRIRPLFAPGRQTGILRPDASQAGGCFARGFVKLPGAADARENYQKLDR